MTSALLDSMVLIDHFNGVPEATELLANLDTPGVSIVTWIEVMAGFGDDTSQRDARSLFTTLDVLPLSQAVAEEAVLVRQQRRLKLPDAVIWATARVHGLVLNTRNTRDFDESDPMIRVPYRI